MPLVKQITDCGETFAISPIAVHTIIDSDKADIVARKDNIRILSNGQIVTPKAGEEVYVSKREAKLKPDRALLSATFMPRRKEPRIYEEMMDYLETY